MHEQLKKLVEEKNNVWRQMQELSERGFETAEDREQFDRMNARLDEIEKDEARLAAAIEREKGFVDRSGVPGAETPESPDGMTRSDEERYAEVFNTWLRYGISELDKEDRELLQARHVSHGTRFETRGLSGTEKRALGTLAGQAGGFTVPEGFWNQIVEARKVFGGLRQAATFKLTTGEGNDIPIPTDDDTGSEGEYIGENTQIGEQDISFDQKVLKAFTVTSKIVRVPVQLLQDSAFDIEAFVARKLGERIGRAEAKKFVNGTGLDQPEGLVTAAPVGHTASSATTFKYADFVELLHSVDPAYRVDPSAGWVMSDGALKQARLITVSSGDDRPLWQPGMVAGEPNQILDHPYVVDNGFDQPASGKKPVAFGALANFWIRDVQGVQLMRLDERYAEYLQVAFLAFARNDSRLVDAGQGPIKVMVMS